MRTIATFSASNTFEKSGTTRGLLTIGYSAKGGISWRRTRKRTIRISPGSGEGTATVDMARHWGGFVKTMTATSTGDWVSREWEPEERAAAFCLTRA